jgi:glycosyltransferase involved in cell wall biosynthesis
MRIPYEGMMVASAFRNGDVVQNTKKLPCFLVSVWGNDFTLHATSTPLMAKQTRATMQIADALHTDCWRDQRLAFQWGFPSDHPAIVLPGSGGIDLDVFSPLSRDHAAGSGEKIVINPRGVRAYIRNDVFFKAAKIVLKIAPELKFVCIGMAGDKGMVDYVESLGISANVDLLPKVPHSQMARLYQEALIAVSPSMHDGTPNTLLESMACGCFPIAGDIESLREWIIPGENGLLVDPSDPKALAQAIVTSLNDETLRLRAAQQNLQLVSTKAAYPKVMAQAEGFYHSILAKTK